jgi:hypothetical protein
MPVAPAPTVADASENMDDMMNDFSANMLDGMTTEAEVNVPRQVALPPQEEPEHVFVPLPPGANSEVSEPEAEVSVIAEPEQVETVDTGNVPIPEPEPEPEPEMSNVEKEFRELVTGLLAAGVDPKDMMDDPRWEDLTERAAAEGFETWPVFLQLAAM